MSDAEDIAVNSLSVLDLQEMFAGAKSMAIVGNSSSVHQWKNGELIDSYDIVVRFNRSVVDGIEEVVGSRTDIIVAN
ncbi:glycosyltransferase family 29 protein [bacterium]|nr:glycosyltransferase family 29 protein [bacterium]MDB4456660.1 glycosyltransferase family 29 protein [bacterium]